MGNAIYLTSSCWDRKKAEFSSVNNSRLSAASPPLSARVDRDEHMLLSARSIAIQKKAPLFRDNGEEEYKQNEALPQLSARKLDFRAIQKLVEEDRRNLH